MRQVFRAAISAWNWAHFSLYRWVFRDERVLWDLDRWGLRIGVGEVLRALGATIGENVSFHRGLVIKNAERGDCANLCIGANAWLGPNLIIDLANPVEIADEAVISDGTIICTHFSVGARPLGAVMPPLHGPFRMGRGAYIGVGSIVLHGVTLGEFSVVGAGSLVRNDVPARSVAVGVPARILRSVELPAERTPDPAPLRFGVA
jgi:acetyltransferase-like isoleucine patch superfamily enzyme